MDRVAWVIACSFLISALDYPDVVSAGSTRVYRCAAADGRVEFRQTPCAQGSQEELHIEDVKVGWDAPAVRVDPPKRKAKSGRAKNSAAAKRKAKKADKCFKKEQNLETLNRRLRRGYKAGQGADLRHRRRQIEAYLNQFCE